MAKQRWRGYKTICTGCVAAKQAKEKAAEGKASKQPLSNPTIEGGGDVTNLSPVEDGNDRKTTPSGDRFVLITGSMNCVQGTLAHQVGG